MIGNLAASQWVTGCAGAMVAYMLVDGAVAGNCLVGVVLKLTLANMVPAVPIPGLHPAAAAPRPTNSAMNWKTITGV